MSFINPLGTCFKVPKADPECLKKAFIKTTLKDSHRNFDLAITNKAYKQQSKQ